MASTSLPPLDLTAYNDEEIARAVLSLPANRIRGVVTQLKALATPIVVGIFMSTWMGIGRAMAADVTRAAATPTPQKVASPEVRRRRQ